MTAPRYNPRPTHHLTLSDGVTTIGLTLCDPRGNPDPRAIRQVPLPKTSLQISQGDPTYGSMQLPFSTVVQKDWSGGRGQLDHNKDSTRYYDGRVVDTRMGDALLGPLETLTTGYLVNVASAARNATFVTNAGEVAASKFVPAQTFLMRKIIITVGKPVGSNKIEVIIRNDNAGVPGAVIVAQGICYDPVPTDPAPVEITLINPATLTAATTYWITVFADSTEVTLGVATGVAGKDLYHDSGGVPPWILWVANAELVYEISSQNSGVCRLYDYRQTLMAGNQADDFSAPRLFMNGYHGMATSNAADKSKLNTTMTLGVGIDLIGKIAKIVSGPGSEEPQNWRTITANTIGANAVITVSPAWNIAHTVATEFAIIGCDTWQEITGHGLTQPVTSVLQVDDIIYFAQGEKTAIRRGKYTLAGNMSDPAQWSWANENDIDATYKGANFLQLIMDSTGKRKIWYAQAVTAKVASSDVKAWGTPLDFGTYANAVVCGNPNAKITNVIGYDSPSVPWVFKEDGFGSISSGTGANIYAPVNLAEMPAVRSENNGRAATSWGVYLFFSVMDGFERFYENRLDDMGPNRDEGLPEERQGIVTKAVPYPGGIFVNVDGGSAGCSSLLYWNQLGWHELLRSQTGERIRDLFIQVIPGTACARLWISRNEDITYVPISLAPYRKIGYHFTANGDLITSWYEATFGGINKYWSSLTLHTENLLAGHRQIMAYYQTDGESDGDAWHLIGTVSTSPIQKLPLSATHSVAGKRIRFKFIMSTDDSTKSPRLKVMTLQTVTRVPPATSWSITYLAASNMQDQQGRWQSVNEQQLRTQMVEWSNSDQHATPLLMRSEDPAYDNRYVFIDPSSVLPLEITTEANGKVRTKKAMTMAIFEAED